MRKFRRQWRSCRSAAGGFPLEGQPFFNGETEACINGRILAAGAYFGAAVEQLLGRLLSEQL